MSKVAGFCVALLLCGTMAPAPAGASLEAEAHTLLQEFAADFRQDQFATELEITFGVTIAEVGAWHLEIAGADTVRLRRGPLPVPGFSYVTDLPTLRRIAAGELNAMTAMGRARMADPAPLDFRLTGGYELTSAAMATFLPLTFHFWNKGRPETVRFGDLDQARLIHGAHATLFYYEPGLRTGYYRLEKGQHINAGASEQVNPFPSLFVFIGGSLDCRIGGEELRVESRQTMFVPAGVPHEFWNPSGQPAEFIIIMFGEGA
jgi:hypothetical protein